jgi:UDP-glucose 4-epimerase
MPLPDYVRHFHGRPVLITGGLGFIGSSLARRLVKLGAAVTLLDSLQPQFGGNRFNLEGCEDRLRVVIGDLRDGTLISDLVQGPAFVFNLAGQSSHLDSMQNPVGDLGANCQSQLGLLEAVRQHNPAVRIVYASTRQVYGRPQYLPVDERHPLAPVDINGIHKQAAEWYYTLYHRLHGLRTTSLRLTNTYGPRMRVVDARQTFLGLWLRQVIMGEPITVFGDGGQKRDLNFVDDVVEALLLASVTSKAEGATYNLGAPDPVSLADLAQLLIEVNGVGAWRTEPFPPDRQAIDIGDYYADFRQIQRVIGWQPIVSLRTGLERSLEYYRAYRKHYW